MPSASHLRPAVYAAEIDQPFRRRRLGEILVESGALDPTFLKHALAFQALHICPLGDLLVAENFVTPQELVRALSRQWSIGRVDLAVAPPDRDLVARSDVLACIAAACVPWRQIGDTVIMALADPARAAEYAVLAPGRPGRIAFAVADRRQILAALAALREDDLVMTALTRCHAAYSSRFLMSRPRRFGALAVLLAALASAAAFPATAFAALLAWVMLANAATTTLRLSAIFGRFRRNRRGTAAAPERRLSCRRRPIVSILVPLYRESATLPDLLACLGALRYPKSLLDVKIILEADDSETAAWLKGRRLPGWVDILRVPPHPIRTKPKAMNYALPFCRGEIVGIYDAEDRPEPEQIDKVVDHLLNAPADVACVQGVLDFYNRGQNWISRCFAIEYAIWFRVLLRGIQELAIPIPLGGTTVFFHKPKLIEMGAWDAHNVTEDADLGMRLARFGYRCEMVATTTWEEANCVLPGWIGQRSRWLKGYALTWITHMRHPRVLLRDLGFWRFAAFQVLFLGAITSYLATPFHWLMWGDLLGLAQVNWSALPPWVRPAAYTSMLVGQSVMLSLVAVAVSGGGRRRLAPWILLLPIYWPLGAVAAYKALFELFAAPFHWRKTRHGL
ncbi:MAG: glycosyltransferase family 2 protein [Paracoccaceae bacterium]